MGDRNKVDHPEPELRTAFHLTSDDQDDCKLIIRRMEQILVDFPATCFPAHRSDINRRFHQHLRND
jgi:hypothetical protein